MDFAELQVKGNNLAAAWEAVGRKVVEVVAAEVKQLRLGGEPSWDFGVTPTLTCGMLGFNLGRVKIKMQYYKQYILLGFMINGGKLSQTFYLNTTKQTNSLNTTLTCYHVLS